jgi:hypothetical protein
VTLAQVLLVAVLFLVEVLAAAVIASWAIERTRGGP